MDPPDGTAERAHQEFDVIEWDKGDGGAYAIITTQTCDLCEEGTPLQPWFQVCAVTKLPDAYAGRTLPSFLYRIEPPDLPTGQWAVDLRMEAPVEKTFLVGKSPLRGFADEEGVVAFADALGRRRDRAALAAQLVQAVGTTLRQRRRNSSSFRRMLREEIYSVRLRIEEGSRAEPVSVRLHVFARGAISDNVRSRFGDWEDEARQSCTEAGMNLFPTQYHDGETDLDLYEVAIPLDLG
jgi:hypothetical protein